jgi:PIN domain nuclease of toxin-antitoxin system
LGKGHRRQQDRLVSQPSGSTNVTAIWSSCNGDIMFGGLPGTLALMDTVGSILVSAISAREIAVLVDKGRLALDPDVADWLDQADLKEGLELVALDRQIGIDSIRLPGDFHKDPVGRIIIATARRLACPVVTADQRIIDYPHVKTVW